MNSYKSQDLIYKNYGYESKEHYDDERQSSLTGGAQQDRYNELLFLLFYLFWFILCSSSLNIKIYQPLETKCDFQGRLQSH